MAEVSGGTVRDTLAGVFHDRPARRFAYSSISSLLFLLSASVLLLAVAARRLALPDALASLPGKAAARQKRRREARERPAEPESSKGTAPAIDETPTPPKSAPEAPVVGTSIDALRQAKARTRGSVNPPPLRAPLPPATPPPLRAPAAGPLFTPPSPGGPPSSRPSGAPRPRSAAEILLERRRGRQR
jgi:hypothetical protein